MGYNTIGPLPIASFNTTFTDPLKACECTFQASQASGTPTPANPISIVGVDKVNVTDCGKNLCGGSKLLANAQAYLIGGTTDTENKTFTFNAGSTTTSGLSFTSGVKFKENTAYTFILTCSKSNTNVGTNIRFLYTDGTSANLSLDGTITADTKYTKAFTSNASKTLDKIIKTNQSGTTTLYYDETGVFEGTLTASEFEAYQGITALINLGGTYYGGSVDAVTGKMYPITKKGSLLKDLTWTYDSQYSRFVSNAVADIEVYSARTTPLRCSHYLPITDGRPISQVPNYAIYAVSKVIYINDSRYTDATTFANSLTNELVEYPLATPETEYASNTAEIPTINGFNQVFADTGDVTVTYRSTQEFYKVGSIFVTANSNVNVSTESGELASFNTPLALPLVSLKASIVATESGSGTKSPTNPYTLGGFSNAVITKAGKNMYSDIFSDYTKNGSYYEYPITLKQGVTYKLSATLVGTAMSGILVGLARSGSAYPYGNQISVITTSGTILNQNAFTVDETWTAPKLLIYCANETEFNNIFSNYHVQLEVGSTATAYEPYTATQTTIDFSNL